VNNRDLLLEIANLPRQSGQADAQTQRRSGDRAQLGDGDEGSQPLEVHGLLISRLHKTSEELCIGRVTRAGHRLRSNIRQAGWAASWRLLQ
jgi:hypothetical protein